MPPLTNQQEMVLSLLPILPSVLSFVCSLTILYIVYQHYHEKGQTTVYHRLLVGMSICDVFVSFWFPWIAFLMPAATSTRIWAIGTTGICTFMGFLFNFAFTGLLYNTSLSYYFLLTARYGWRDQEIAKCVEPLMHALVLAFPITCGLVFTGLGVYGEQSIGLSCWVDDYPHGCGSDPGQQPCITPMLGWISAGIPMFFSFVSLFINNSLIYCHVWSTIHKVRQYSSQFIANSSSRSMYTSKRSLVPDAQTRRLQSVATQAGLYLLVFLLNYIWTVILKNLGAQERYWTNEHESELFWLLVLQAIFLPLQGFFNLCVFSRPKYLQTRKKFPNHSRLWVFKRAMFGESKAPFQSKSSSPSSMANNKSSTAAVKHDSRQIDEEEPHSAPAQEGNHYSTEEEEASNTTCEKDESSNLPTTKATQPLSLQKKSLRRSSASLRLSSLLRSSVQQSSSFNTMILGIRTTASESPLFFDRETNDDGPTIVVDRPLQQLDFDSFLFGFDDDQEEEVVSSSSSELQEDEVVVVDDEEVGAIEVEGEEATNEDPNGQDHGDVQHA